MTPIASIGDPVEDLRRLIADFDGDLSASYLVSDPLTFTQMALWRDAAGNAPFVDLGPRGGSAIGIPALASRSSPRASTGGNLILVDPTGIAYGSEGVRITKSEQASIAMNDNPDNPPLGTTTLVSLWQSNLTALLAEIAVSWKVVRPGSVSIVTGAQYSAESP